MPRFTSQTAYCVALTTAVLVSGSAPSQAGGPLARTAIAINNIRLATPLSFDKVFATDQLGLDQEPAALKKALLKQAADYIEFRRGSATSREGARWLEKCRSENEKETINPYCLYEIKRREAGGPQAKSASSSDRRTLAGELRAGNFESAAFRSQAEISAAVRQLEKDRQLAKVAMNVADHQSCVPAGVASSLASKLEERFPAIEIIELTKRLYRKALSCGNDIVAAHASFRLGLLHLWEDDCTQISSLMLKVESIKEASQYHARAKYWRYFCAERTGDILNREFARASLLKDHPMSFQTLAATAEDDSLMDQIISQPVPQIALRSLVRTDINHLLRGTEALIRLNTSGLPAQLASEIIDQSVKEMTSLEPEVRLYVAVLMNRIGATLPKFKVLNELFLDAPQTVSLQTLKLYFPLSYLELVQTKQQEVDPLLIISLIRQESAFNKEARSIAGARGLMQVMPATARMVARKKVSRLYEPAINIEVGTKYFLSRLRQYEGDVELTLAAYNAGFNRVDDWRKRYPTDNRLLFLDLIPFRETRDYVSSILRNYYWYVKLYSPQLITENHASHSVSAKTDSILSAKAGLAASVPAPRLPASESLAPTTK